MRKNNEDIYQMFHGLKPVKRDDKKPGQSEWYYIDPRYEEDKARSQIDITNENEPNPRIRAILADDMRKNPEDYYIWRTQKDDRVRGKHAEREGKIFNRHVPPVGGNPGDDYNCRCWEEPYKPDKLNITPKVDLSGLPQYAENDKVGTKNDAVYDANYEYAHRKVKFRSPEEEKLLRHIAKVIVKSENIKQHPYLDTMGKITTGKGNNIDVWGQFKAVHWEIDGRPATEQEIKAMYDELCRQREKLKKEYDEVQNFKRTHPEEYAKWPTSKRKDKGPFNYTADHYAQFTNIRITEDEADYLMYSHLQDDYDTIKGFLFDFDNQPMGIKEAAFDIQYNTGNIRSFGKFKKAYDKNDIEEMARQSGRKIISKDRNDDIKNRILKTK